MLEIVICDDEKFYRNDLQTIISTELDLSGIAYRITEFSSGEELLSKLSPNNGQIIFLDIEMKGLDGISAAKQLRERNNRAQIIFVTSHPDFVFQGYEVRALNYLLKPYEKKKLLAVLHTALEELSLSAEKYFVLEQKGCSIRIPLQSIRYFASDKRIVTLVTDTDTYTFYDKLNDVETRLTDAFVRIHNRYLIHLKYLDAIDGNQAVICGEALPVARSCKAQLSIAFANYMLH